MIQRKSPKTTPKRKTLPASTGSLNTGALAPDVEPKVDTFIVTISGFTERPDEWSGMAKLNYRLRLQYAGPCCMVFHRAWNDDFDELARVVRMWGTTKRRTRIVVAGYSWGCGRGVTRFAAALGKVGMSIDRLLLIDPVIRPGSRLPADLLLGKLLAIKAAVAMTSLGRFTVPANVLRVAVFRQTNGRPFGRKLKLAGTATRLLNEYIFGRDMDFEDESPETSFITNGVVVHSTIDDLIDIHRCILNHVKEELST